MRLLLLLAASSAFMLPTIAEACSRGTQIGHGETADRIATRCGVNVEALKQLNPGLGVLPARAGTFVAVPARPLPSPVEPIGRQRVRIVPPGVTSPAIGLRMAPPHQTF